MRPKEFKEALVRKKNLSKVVALETSLKKCLSTLDLVSLGQYCRKPFFFRFFDQNDFLDTFLKIIYYNYWKKTPNLIQAKLCIALIFIVQKRFAENCEQKGFKSHTKMK